MENWTVKFLEDCDNQDARGVYKAGSMRTIRYDSALFWISRGKAVRVVATPPPASASKKQPASVPTVPTVQEVAAEIQKAASDLEAATGNTN